MTREKFIGITGAIALAAGGTFYLLKRWHLFYVGDSGGIGTIEFREIFF